MTTQTLLPQPRFARPLNLISLAMLALLVIVSSSVIYHSSTFGSGSAQPSIMMQPTANATDALSLIPDPTAIPSLTMASQLAQSIGKGILLSDNQGMSGEIDKQNSVVGYYYIALADGVLAVNVHSDDFQPHVLYLRPNAPTNSLAENDPAQSTDVTLYDHVQKGEMVGIDVRSEKSAALGAFTINAALAQPIALTYNTPFDRQIVIPPEATKTPPDSNAFHYFTFDAKAGDVIDVRVKSNQNLDMTMYIQSFTQQPMTLPIFNSTFKDGCTASAYYQQCFNDDSGGGTDPEIRHLVVQDDRHFEVFISGIGLYTGTVNYQLTVSKQDPIPLGSGSTLNTTLTWKAPILPLLMIAQKGKPITIRLNYINGAKRPFELIAVQDGLGLNDAQINFDPITTLLSHTPFTITPQSDNPVVLFVKYAQPPIDGTQNIISIERQ